KLLKDVTEDVVIPADQTITLDLNGKKLTNKTGHTITVEQGATLTINGKGTVDNVTHQKTTIYNKGTVTLNGGTYDRSKEDGIGGSNTYYTLLNHGTMTVANVTVNNEGGYSSLFENGYFDYSKSRDGIDNPTLTIESGTFTGGINTVKNDDGATMTINGGIFTNYAQSAFQNHNIATINGGTFNGATVYAILNCGTGCKSDAAPDLHQLTITDGNFNGKIYKGGDSKDGTHYDIGSISITGGYFTTDPSAYVASDYVAGTSDVSGYSYKVVAKTNTGFVEVKPDVADPEVKVSDSISKEDQAKVAAAAATVSAPTLGAAATDEAQKIDKTKADELVAKATEVAGNTADKKLYVQSSLKVEPTAYDAANKTLALEITPQYRVVASTATTADEIKLDGNKNAQVVQDYQNMTIDTPTEVTMELPTGFAVADGAKLSIKHTKSNGKVEYYTGTVTKKDNKLYLTFTTNGFSPFVISVPAAAIESKVYPTLQAAVDSAKNGDIIDLYKDVAADTKVTVAKTIKFEVATNEKTFAKENIVAGANTTVKVTGDVSPYTYEFTYTKPSSGGSSSGKTTYKVTTSAVNNGGVNASPSNAEKGATITITLSPDKGYKLDKLTVTDGSGKTVSTVKKSDTVYTFTMSASAVNVGVSYVKATETPSETKFNDVSANDWFASAVDYVTGKGMMNGTADNTFSPKANTTRGMVVTVLYRLENQPSTSAASFTDVASGAYYANAVAWANANGIVSGYGSGKFGPNDKVTREQLAAILYRYAQYKKYDVSVGEDTNILSYDDAQSISSYAIPAIQWACGAGVVTGKSGSKLDPKGNATRAEVAAMLMRFCENVK
uniref:S-layer homology domain-containing protein n=1 Tax=Agathobaculum sp. TaxID=2048138 RepID=UPI003A9508F6